jgi:Vitamin B12 dependent methionine synthase, activation domain
VRTQFAWTAAHTVPARPAVLALQGIAANDNITARIDGLLQRAIDMYCEVAEPRAIVADVTADEFERVYQGEGCNAPETPVAAIYQRADRLALMVATVGPRVPDAIRDLFRRQDLALACMLDSVASAAADSLADTTGRAYRFGSLAPDSSVRVLAYSPGYCGWHVSGQRALFAWLRPEEIGVTLNASCLMQPLKSVSGVLVAGGRDIHRFHPTYPFCEPCGDKPCRDRMASVVKPALTDRR